MKISYIKSLILLSLLLSISGLLEVYALDNCDTITEIDGITTASTRFKIINGNACETYADITWWDYYSNGTEHILKYGTTPSFGNQINLKPFTAKTDITTTIPNLKPNTKYYAQFYRRRNSVEANLDFTFTTMQPTSIKNLLKKESLSLPLEQRFRITDNKLLLGNNLKTGDNIIISDLKGKKLFHYIHEFEISKIALPAISKGMYLVTQLRNGRVVRSNNVIVAANAQ